MGAAAVVLFMILGTLMASPPLILSVDDQDAARYLRTRVLSGAGFRVLEAATGAAALAAAIEHRPDVVVLDLKLPDMDGYEVCRLLRERPETAAIPVLEISAVFRAIGDHVAALDCGADAFLPEPVSPEVLIATVRALCRVRQTTGELEREIARRKEAEAALEREKRRLDEVFAVAPVCVAAYSGPEHIVDFTNPAIQALWGGRNPVGKPLREAFPEIGEPLISQWDAVYLSGRPFTARELAAQVATGKGGREEFFFDIALHPRVDAGGRVTGILAFGTDQTERVRSRRAAERLAAEAEEGRRTLQALMEHAPEGITIADAPDVTIRMVSRHGRELAGRPPELLEGIPLAAHVENWGILRPDGSRPAPEELPLSRAVLEGEIVHGEEWLIERPSGDTITILCNAGPIRDAHGAVTGGVIVWRDISARKELQERLLELQKLESLGVLAGGVAHDFNNLLTGIMGYASLLEESGAVAGSYADLLEGIVDASRRAAELTQQMLAYSGKGSFLVQPHEAGRLIAETAAFISHAVPKKASLTIHVPEELALVEADGAQFSQLLTNLLLNAVEAVGDGPGAITLIAGVDHVDASWVQRRHLRLHTATDLHPGQYVWIDITDTGCGMDEAATAKAFDPFYTTKFTGRGLGLPAALGIVRAHRGAIAMRSAPGKGSSFVVLLPVYAASVAPPLAASPDVGDLRGTETILVVDDEQIVRDLARSALERYGYQVLLAPDGISALETYQREAARIDAVVLDLSMPGLDGREVMDRLEALDPHLPVVIISGYSESAVASRFSGTGAAGFLQKPFRAEQMARAVRAALARKRR